MSSKVSKPGRSCIFCGDLSLTQEHVVPGWLQKYVGQGKATHFHGTWISFAGLPIDKRKASGNSHTLGTVCRDCNNGWMASLEEAFGSLLPRIAAGDSPRGFSKSERVIIAQWIVKTGIVAHFSSNYRRILPVSVPLALRKGTCVPPGIIVFGGKAKNVAPLSWYQSNLHLATLRKFDLGRFDPKSATFVFVVQICGIFLGYAWHALDKRNYKLLYSDRSLNQFYPHPKCATRSMKFDDLSAAAMAVYLSAK